MFGLFKKDPAKKLEKEYRVLLEKARDIQRSGDLRHYSRLMEEAAQMEKKLAELQNKLPNEKLLNCRR